MENMKIIDRLPDLSVLGLPEIIVVIISIFLFLLGLLWLILPVIVLMMQKRNRELLAVNRRILSELERLNRDVSNMAQETEDETEPRF